MTLEPDSNNRVAEYKATVKRILERLNKGDIAVFTSNSNFT